MGQDQSQNKFLFMLRITSEGKMWRYVFLVVLFSQTLTALQIPKRSDVFSSLEPYKDPETLLLEEEDAGEARLGFVQLPNTGFNATLNLSGHIILGLGIAASLMWYMFLSAFNRGSDHYYYGGYNRRYGDDYDYVEKRSVDDLSAVLDEAILAHSFGAMDVKTCGDKVLCEIFIPKESLEDALPQLSSHTLRNLVREKFRDRGEFLDLKRCQYLSKSFCSLTAQQIEAIIDTPIPET